MIITWNIQKVNFFADEVEEKGLIDLDGAIQNFQEFPWEEQLKELKKREMTSSMPTINFVSDQGQRLGICTTELNHFELHYENGTKYTHLTISNDFNINQKVISIEDFIELFFNGEFENNIKLENKPITAKKETQYQYEINQNKNIKHLAFSFLWFVLNVLFIVFFLNEGLLQKEKTLTIGMQIIILLFWAPGFYLYITYSRKNKNAKLAINKNDRTAFYSDLNQNITFTRDDIKFSLLSVTKSSRSSWSEYKNLRIDLKNGKSIWVTFLLADIEEVISNLGLHYKEEEYFIPTL